MASGPLYVEREPGIAVVTIDAPPLHLVDGPLLGSLLALLPELEADADLRAVVFRSADPDFFLMHGDVEALTASGQTRDGERDDFAGVIDRTLGP